MSSLDSKIPDLTDSDILRIEEVIQIINERQGQYQVLESFRKEIIERFAEAGFKVDVRAFTTNQEALYSFDIEIQDRLAGEFDPDKMVYEATHDILDLGTKGVIKTETDDDGNIRPQGHGHKH